ncbi:DUF2878 domain-containing protein [Psychrosphaera ytuae]|uniref:DUF2878 domain-containing protein n=1 Tax=Psychrosphaera ytuae TaxID=2820710 RepID=A0A975HH68_9GAMM|nr:DUF2878 domain-containing protein [Psychrosphaera ytuae]QTH62866.1 DUF2878 domain-containing protein [Psychrosphaera ytuae]
MLLNFVFFQLIWFGSILIGNAFIPLAALIFFLHFRFTSETQHDKKIMAIAALIGVVVDSLLMFFGVFEFQHGLLVHWLIPPWLVVLWMAFAMTLNHSLAYFQKQPLLAFIGGAVSGPLSYLAGVKLGAIQIGYSYSVTFIVFAFIWGPLFWGLTRYIDWLNHPSPSDSNLNHLQNQNRS